MTQPIEIERGDSPATTYPEELAHTLSSILARPGVGVLLTPTVPEITPLRRLLVLIPDCEVDERALARTLWSLAERRQLNVLLVGTVGQRDSSYAHRRLINLATQIRDGRLRVDMVLRPRPSWLEAITELRRPGDLIICHAQQKVSLNGWQRQPLAQVLSTYQPSPIYVLNDFYARLPIERPLFWGRLVSWLVPLLMITGFTLFQLWLSQQTVSWFYFLGMGLSLFLEVIAIAAWEGVFG